MRNKTGLQRQISEIFDGVGVPKRGDHSNALPSKPEKEMPHRAESITAHPDSPGLPKTTASVGPHSASQWPEHKSRRDSQPERPRGSGSVHVLEHKYRTGVPKPGGKTVREKVKIGAVLLLTAVLAWQLMHTSFLSSGAEDGTNLQSVETVAKPAPKISIAWPVPPLYPQNIRDPMQWIQEPPPSDVAIAEVKDPGGPQAKNPAGLIVRGIVHSEDKPRAIIGTELVQEGDVVQGATVLRINRKTVEFEQNGRTWIQEVEDEQAGTAGASL